MLRRIARFGTSGWASGDDPILRGLIGAATCPSLDAKFRSLTELNLSFCAGLRDTHLQNLASTLRSLTLDGCHGVTDAGVKLAAERSAASARHGAVVVGHALQARACFIARALARRLLALVRSPGALSGRA